MIALDDDIARVADVDRGVVGALDVVAVDHAVARADREGRVLLVAGVDAAAHRKAVDTAEKDAGEAGVLDPPPVSRDVVKRRRQASRSAGPRGYADADREAGRVEYRAAAAADRDPALRNRDRLVIAELTGRVSTTPRKRSAILDSRAALRLVGPLDLRRDRSLCGA